MAIWDTADPCAHSSTSPTGLQEATSVSSIWEKKWLEDGTSDKKGYITDLAAAAGPKWRHMQREEVASGGQLGSRSVTLENDILKDVAIWGNIKT